MSPRFFVYAAGGIGARDPIISGDSPAPTARLLTVRKSFSKEKAMHISRARSISLRCCALILLMLSLSVQAHVVSARTSQQDGGDAREYNFTVY